MSEISDILKTWITMQPKWSTAELKEFHRRHGKAIATELESLDEEGRAALKAFRTQSGGRSLAEVYFGMLNDHRRGEATLEEVRAFYRRCEPEILREIQEGQDIVRAAREAE